MNRKSVEQTSQVATRLAEPPQHHQPHHPDHTRWRARAIACLRVSFGLVWAVAAWLKWQPAFQQSFLTQMTKASAGQAPAMQAWIVFWSSLISLNPPLFARLEASTETALAFFLILGLFSNLSYVVGLFLALGIWAIPEGFGGPYQPGQTTDIGTALPYALLFGALLVASAGRFYALDQWLTPRLGCLGFLAAGSLHKWELERERVCEGHHPLRCSSEAWLDAATKAQDNPS